MNNRDYWTVEAMTKFGGSFVKALAECARHADPINLNKIKLVWSEYWLIAEEQGHDIEKQGEKINS